MNRMYRVEIVATLESGRSLSDDEITDIIEVVVDDLDRLALLPSVGSARRGRDVELVVTVTVDEPDEWDALARAGAAARAAFHGAGIGTAGFVTSRDLRSHVSPLLPV